MLKCDLNIVTCRIEIARNYINISTCSIFRWWCTTADLIQSGGNTLRFEIHKLINCIWNTEELPEQWKGSIVVPTYKKGDKTACINYQGISLLSTSYKILSNILLSRLTPYVDKIIGDHQCGFRCNWSTTDQIFCICQILEKKWEYNGTVHKLIIDFKKAYDSVRREVLYNILIEFVIPRKLVKLIKMCLNETYSKAHTGKHLSGVFPILLEILDTTCRCLEGELFIFNISHWETNCTNWVHAETNEVHGWFSGILDILLKVPGLENSPFKD
jgi:hypothetical protein